MSISAEQVRGARGLLGWSQTRLAEAAGLSLPTIKRFETGAASVSEAAVAAVRTALEIGGILFVPENGAGPGVRLAKRSTDETPSPEA